MALFDTKRWLHDPRYAIKVAWVTSIVVASITTLLVIVGRVWPETLGTIAPMSSLLDVVLVLGLGYGVHRQSRVCAVLLLTYWVIAKVDLMIRLHTGLRTDAVLIGFIFLMGARGTFLVNQSGQASDDERYKPPTAAT